MKYYKITKHFQGGQSTFYASLSINKRVKRGQWEAQLEHWGEGTSGGHNYGYRMYAKPCNSKKCPKPINPKFTNKLSFSDHYIEDIPKVITISLNQNDTFLIGHLVDNKALSKSTAITLTLPRKFIRVVGKLLKTKIINTHSDSKGCKYWLIKGKKL